MRPGCIEWYPVIAVPVAFLASALVGMALERSVIRWLYGRPLETLLATWGISLFLIQLVRQIFGAQNVEVANPSWMSGGIEFANLTLPYNRIVIIGFAFVVLVLMWLVLSRTRLGLFVRGVTQNRTMASCVGVNTGRVDLLAFGLGSGIAGLAGRCVVPGRQRRTGAGPVATSSTPSWSWCWAGSGSSRARCTRPWAWAWRASCWSRTSARC